jgi:hypothetical protein
MLVTMDERERKVLRVVVEHQLATATPAPLQHVLLSFPADVSNLVEQAITALVASGALERGREASGQALHLTAAGLCSSALPRAGDAAKFAEQLVRWLTARAVRERGAFSQYTWEELRRDGIAAEKDYELVISTIQLFQLCDPNGTTWAATGPHVATWRVPSDLAQLRSVDDINALLARLETRAPHAAPAESPLEVGRSRVQLLDLQRELECASAATLATVAKHIQDLAGGLPDNLQAELRGYAASAGQTALSEPRRFMAVSAAAGVCRQLHRRATFRTSPPVDNGAYATFLRAALHEDGKLPAGTSIAVRAIEKRARLEVAVLHAAIARALDEELAYVSDIDEQAYSIQVNHEDVEHALGELAHTAARLAQRPQPRQMHPPSLAIVLFLASNPATTDTLALDEEARDIEEKIRAAKHRDSLLLKTRWAVRPGDLLQALNQDRPTVVHFSGHGAGVAGIAFHDDEGGTRLVKAEALRYVFEALKDDIRLVVLNACYSVEQAEAIATVIDCVVGMSDSIGDTAARRFAASFYRALGFGRSVKNAFAQGVAAIKLEGLADDHIPQLIVRKGADADAVLVVPHP